MGAVLRHGAHRAGQATARVDRWCGDTLGSARTARRVASLAGPPRHCARTQSVRRRRTRGLRCRADISPATASQDLRRLLDAGFVAQEGRTRSTRFSPPNSSGAKPANRSTDRPSPSSSNRSLGLGPPTDRRSRPGVSLASRVKPRDAATRSLIRRCPGVDFSPLRRGRDRVRILAVGARPRRFQIKTDCCVAPRRARGERR